MDPDAALERALDLAQCVAQGSEDGLAVELAWAVRDLDGWLRRGGFPPKAWQSPEAAPGVVVVTQEVRR